MISISKIKKYIFPNISHSDTNNRHYRQVVDNHRSIALQLLKCIRLWAVLRINCFSFKLLSHHKKTRDVQA